MREGGLGESIDPRLAALLADVKPSVLLLVAIDEDGYLAISSAGDVPIPYSFDGTLLTLDLSVLVAPNVDDAPPSQTPADSSR